MKTRADCTVRALAASAGIAYELADSIAADAGRDAGRRFKSRLLIEAAKRQGITFRKIRMGSRTLRKFLREHPIGRFYLRKRGHAFAVINGVPTDSTSLDVIVLDAWQLGLEVQVPQSQQIV